ncbi:MAG TPA: hypothetical protein VGY54_10080 [Polyangiaceae bacterium]|nr:hypothetical protein [Polyangiaceae bacterium]
MSGWIGLASFIAALWAWAAYSRRKPPWSVFPSPPRPTETTPIASTPDTGTVTCGGKVVSSDATFESPSGGTVVWYECVIRRQVQGSEGPDEPDPPIVLREACAFEIDDGSGDQLRIVPARGYLLPDAASVRPSLSKGDLGARLQRILIAHGRSVGPDDILLVSESHLALGDHAIVRGAIHRPIVRSYRDSGWPHRVVAADGGGLIVWAPVK